MALASVPRPTANPATLLENDSYSFVVQWLELIFRRFHEVKDCSL
jgi:hypothetical protein